MEILRGYRLGPNLHRLLQRYWYEQVMVPKAYKCLGQIFQMERVVTQRDLVSPIIFNIVVDAVVRVVLLEFWEPQEAHHGMGWVVFEHNIIFYADNYHIEVCNPIWVQMILTAVVRMSDRVGLLTNLSITKSMVYTPVFIWVQHGTAEYKRITTGEGVTFW